MTNFLATSIDVFSNFGSITELNWIGNIIKALIEGCGSVGIGIIVFTLILKVITLPLDIISRTSMKKSSLKMKRMRPQLEKLQRQYANNKQLYNQKIQALYKKEGYSMFASCLPTIISLVFFIVVITQFSNYSNYSEAKLINGMAESYSQTIINYNTENETQVLYVNEVVNEDQSKSYTVYINENYTFENEEFFADARKIFTKTASTENDYVASFKYNGATLNEFGMFIKSLNDQGFTAYTVGEDAEKNHILVSGSSYSFNKNMFKTAESGITENLTDDEINEIISNEAMKFTFNQYANQTIKAQARESAKLYYEENVPNFLWIKNLWIPDLPFKHPVASSISEYNFAKANQTEEFQAYYEEITSDLGAQKSSANGYLILIICSIGLMLLSQIISQRAQKDQMELQSADGQAAQTSKMMTWMMPIIFGVFSFFYSASFSLYMVISTLFSTLSTVIINFFVERSFNKKYGA